MHEQKGPACEMPTELEMLTNVVLYLYNTITKVCTTVRKIVSSCKMMYCILNTIYLCTCFAHTRKGIQSECEMMLQSSVVILMAFVLIGKKTSCTNTFVLFNLHLLMNIW